MADNDNTDSFDSLEACLVRCAELSLVPDDDGRRHVFLPNNCNYEGGSVKPPPFSSRVVQYSIGGGFREGYRPIKTEHAVPKGVENIEFNRVRASTMRGYVTISI